MVRTVSPSTVILPGSPFRSESTWMSGPGSPTAGTTTSTSPPRSYAVGLTTTGPGSAIDRASAWRPCSASPAPIWRASA